MLKTIRKSIRSSFNFSESDIESKPKAAGHNPFASPVASSHVDTTTVETPTPTSSSPRGLVVDLSNAEQPSSPIMSPRVLSPLSPSNSLGVQRQAKFDAMLSTVGVQLILYVPNKGTEFKKRKCVLKCDKEDTAFTISVFNKDGSQGSDGKQVVIPFAEVVDVSKHTECSPTSVNADKKIRISSLGRGPVDFEVENTSVCDAISAGLAGCVVSRSPSCLFARKSQQSLSDIVDSFVRDFSSVGISLAVCVPVKGKETRKRNARIHFSEQESMITVNILPLKENGAVTTIAFSVSDIVRVLTSAGDAILNLPADVIAAIVFSDKPILIFEFGDQIQRDSFVLGLQTIVDNKTGEAASSGVVDSSNDDDIAAAAAAAEAKREQQRALERQLEEERIASARESDLRRVQRKKSFRVETASPTSSIESRSPSSRQLSPAPVVDGVAKKIEQDRIAAMDAEHEKQRALERQLEIERKEASLAAAKKREEDRIAAIEKKQDEERRAAIVKQQEDERIANEIRLEQERIGAVERKLEQDRLAAIERMREQERIEEEIRLEQERIAAIERKREEDRLAAIARKREQERIEEEIRSEQERIAAVERRREEDQLAAIARKREQERIEDERRVEKQRIAEIEKQREEDRLAAIAIKNDQAHLARSSIQENYSAQIALKRELVSSEVNVRHAMRTNALAESEAVTAHLRNLEVCLAELNREKDIGLTLKAELLQLRTGDHARRLDRTVKAKLDLKSTLSAVLDATRHRSTVLKQELEGLRVGIAVLIEDCQLAESTVASLESECDQKRLLLDQEQQRCWVPPHDASDEDTDSGSMLAWASPVVNWIPTSLSDLPAFPNFPFAVDAADEQSPSTV